MYLAEIHTLQLTEDKPVHIMPLPVAADGERTERQLRVKDADLRHLLWAEVPAQS